jgi:hypothetical protein
MYIYKYIYTYIYIHIVPAKSHEDGTTGTAHGAVGSQLIHLLLL